MIRLATPTSYAVQSELSSPKWACAFSRGCGGEATPNEDLLPGPVAMFGSPARWALLHRAIAEGRDWYYGDHAYFRRARYFRVTRNRYQHDGRGSFPDGAQRLRAAGTEIYPHWKTEGSSIVVCPNSPTYMALFGIDAHAWVLDIVARLGQLTDRPIIVRWKAQAIRRPLYVDLHDAYLVITFSSNAAVEAIAAGVPCCTLAPFAASTRMGITSLDDIERPIYPDDREPFLYALAANQFTLDEMASGYAWRVIRDQAEQESAC